MAAVAVCELRGPDEAVGLALLATVGFSSAVADGVTGAEVLLGAIDVDGEIVGALRARCRPRAQQSVVGLLGVRRDRRRQGVGRALLDAFWDREIRAGADHVDVQVRPGLNDAALRQFYESCGFAWSDGVFRR